jgi:hypothetical protein
MTQKDQVFIANVVVIDLHNRHWFQIINQLANVIAELNVITKICKYRKLHEGHHLILMAMEVHDAPRHDMDYFIKECACLFHDRQLKGHLSLYFYIHFFRQRISIALQSVLTSTINRKIMLVGDVYSRPPITIRSHDLHVGDIKGCG